jgi:IS1 family transposase
MNILATDKRAQILHCLVEGNSMRATCRLTGAAKKTVERLLVSAGHACRDYQDKVMRNLNCKLLQVDEVWAFCWCKEAQVPENLRGTGIMGDIWTWVAIDAETKLIPAWYVGTRDMTSAMGFINNVRSRLANRIQLTSDGHGPYLAAVKAGFGDDVDYAILQKIYGRSEVEGPRRYSPPHCIGISKRTITGMPDPAHVSTSFVERSNLTLRMSNRRFTRLTTGFSKQAENHGLMIAISMMHYNFARIHQTLRVTPAMAAGVADHVWSLEEIAALCENKGGD